jgi:hypothetical protein
VTVKKPIRSLKRRSVSTRQYGVTSQKTAIFTIHEVSCLMFVLPLIFVCSVRCLHCRNAIKLLSYLRWHVMFDTGTERAMLQLHFYVFYNAAF